MFQCFLNQDYPKHRIEWIIVDDGFDPIEDLVKDIPFVKYFNVRELPDPSIVCPIIGFALFAGSYTPFEKIVV
jgi:hypothetical protein